MVEVRQRVSRNQHRIGTRNSLGNRREHLRLAGAAVVRLCTEIQPAVSDTEYGAGGAILRAALACSFALGLAAGLEIPRVSFHARVGVATKHCQNLYARAFFHCAGKRGAKREHGIDPRVAQLALKAAQRSVELSKEDVPDYLDSLAQAQLCTGDAKSAVTTEEKAVKLLREKYTDVPASYVKRFEDRLERYRKAVDSAAQKSDKSDEAAGSQSAGKS